MFRVVIGLLFIFSSIRPCVLAGPTHEIVTDFELAPSGPGYAPLTVGPDGEFWGTTPGGGAYGFGTIYRVDPESGDWKTIVSFTSNRSFDRGANPLAGLTNDGMGSLWGTTQKGGANGCGTVFKFETGTGTLTTVVDFTNRNPGNKGATAAGTLVSDGAGFFWGATTYGGNADGFGTIFKVSASTGTLTTVIEFSSNGITNKGAEPLAGLVLDDTGDLWGTTSKGGAQDAGTVFTIDRSTGELTTVIEFTHSGAANKGATPAGELFPDGTGFLWGSTVNGGADGYGTIFKVNISTGVLTTLVEFKDRSGTVDRGAFPYGQLSADGSNFLWGTTSRGGVNSVGTIFKVNRSTGALTTVFELRANSASIKTGQIPQAGLLSDGSGNFWGTTGLLQFGTDTVVRIVADTGEFATVVTFATNATTNAGRSPSGGLVSDDHGYLWGTTRSGGPRFLGTIFKTDQISGETTTLVELGENDVRGAQPTTELVPDGDGYLWGTSEQGGNSGGYGTIFKVNIATGDLTTLVDFGSTGPVKGSTPRSGLVPDGLGNFWGTTYAGGDTINGGTIFKVKISTGDLTTVYSFDQNQTSVNGDEPFGTLVPDGSGFLWGTTSHGAGYGTIYKVNIGTGALSKVFQFTSSPNHGAFPQAGLVSDGEGFFWGTTQRGGADDFGTVFKIRQSTGAFSKVADFTSNGVANRGANPLGALISDGAGSLWGTTSSGGTGGSGTVFKINAETGEITTLIDFTGTGPQPGAGANPAHGALFKSSDGNFYGTTTEGGPGGAGTVFRIRLGPTPMSQPATLITETSAELQGSINPNGVASAAGFEWGTDPTLSMSTLADAGTTDNQTVPEIISAHLTGLAPATTYFYRARGTNADSVVPQRGAILSFTTLNPDMDNDGLRDEWEKLHFGNTALRTATDDSDKDGMIELVEYAFDRDPNRPDADAIPSVGLENGYLTVTLTKRPSITFQVETAGELIPEAWSTATTVIITDTDTMLRVRDSVPILADMSRFLRVRISSP